MASDDETRGLDINCIDAGVVLPSQRLTFAEIARITLLDGQGLGLAGALLRMRAYAYAEGRPLADVAPRRRRPHNALRPGPAVTGGAHKQRSGGRRDHPFSSTIGSGLRRGV
jgi:hypothetical protein